MDSARKTGWFSGSSQSKWNPFFLFCKWFPYSPQKSTARPFIKGHSLWKCPWDWIWICLFQNVEQQILLFYHCVSSLSTRQKMIYLSIYLSVCLSIYLPISIYLYLSISIYLYLSISIYLSIHLSIYLFISIHLSLSISIYLYLSLSISIYLSI